MSYSSLDELLTEILVIKDLYICGRMNQSICMAVVGSGAHKEFSKKNWKQYEKLSSSYVSDSMAELGLRREEILEKVQQCGPVSINVIYDTSYTDFDDELMNDMMSDFYGSKDSIAFASSYNYFSEDFNAILSEFAITELV